MTEAYPVLWQTKLHRPRVTPSLVHRPRLFDQLNSGLHHRLILVCAPAGFGKTTLISSWIEELSAGEPGGPAALPSAWLSLEESESDAGEFVRYMIAAIRTIFPEACSETFEMLQRSHRLPAKVIAASLSNEIDRLPDHLLLVLDDFQTIRGKAVPNLLNRLLAHWPQPLHLALISRTNPPLQLAKLRAGDKLTEIRSRDLRFGREETAQFLSRTLLSPVDDTLLDQVEAKVEGWIGALRLAALSMRARSGMAEKLAFFERSDDTLVEYLVYDVLLQQFPIIQSFLLKTSILERFSAPLCEAVIGEIDPAWSITGCIDWLEREELFITALDDHRSWYRIHHLLRDVLQQRAGATLPREQVRELHSRASGWFEQHALYEEALRHASMADDLNRIARLIERALPDVLDRSDWPTMERWLRLLPAEMIHSRPWLMVVKVWTLHFSWRLKELSESLLQLEALVAEEWRKRPDGEHLRPLRAQIALLKSQEAYFGNRSSDAVAYAQEALTLTPSPWAYVRGGSAFYITLGRQAVGDGLDAERLLRDKYAALDIKTDGYALRLLLGLGLTYFNQGQFEELRQIATLMHQQATQGRDVVIPAWAHFLLGVVHYQWNELEYAAQQFKAVIDRDFMAHQIALQNSLYGLALVQQARGESDKALGLVERAAQADIKRIGYIEEGTQSCRARLDLSQGKPESAFRWADSFTFPVPDRPVLWLEIPHLTRARVLLARGNANDVQQALHTTNALIEIAERTHNTRGKIEVLAVRALALDAQGETGAAQADLREAIALSRAGDFLRVFVDLGGPMQQLLANLSHNGSPTESVGRILAAFPGNGRYPDAVAPQTAPAGRPAFNHPMLAGVLTPRESQILVHLREPISLKEIAHQEGISYATVKRHSVNIYGKLGVNSRWDAVALATELGLLPSR